MVTSNFFDLVVDDAALKTEKRVIGETFESRIKGIESLKRKLLKVHDLKTRLDDEFLLRFLRVAKFDVKKAYERIQKYYSIRKTYNHIFKDFFPSAVKTALKTGHFLACPFKTTDNSIVVILKRGMYDPSKMIYEEVFLMDCLVLDFISENPFAQLSGVHAILDLDGYGFQHFVQDTPGRVRMAVYAMQNSFPIRYKTVHIINAPQVFSFVHNLCYPFLTNKIRKRLFLHKNNNWKNLHSTISPDILPLDYGGKIPNEDLIDLTDEVMKKDEHFKEQLQYGFIRDT